MASRSGRRSAREASRGSRGALAAVVVLIVILLLVCTVFARMFLGHGSVEQTQGAGFDEAVQVDDAQQSEEEIAQHAAEAAAADLAWRDTDFAVDPSRTDWNYEPNGEKTVYLTFDDGPSANTERVLDILDSYGIKATFFVTAIQPDYAPWIKEAYSRGHTIGMHTYSHDYAQVYSSVDAYFADLDAIGQVVQDQIGYVPCFIRFPGGSSNTVSRNYTSGIMTMLSQEVLNRGYQYYDWNASCGDGSDHPADVLYAEATKFDGTENIILLMHDSAAKDTTVEALPQVIEYYQGQGYVFKAIDRSTMVPHHSVNN